MTTPMESLKMFVDMVTANEGWEKFPIAWNAYTKEDVAAIANDHGEEVTLSNEEIYDMLSELHIQSLDSVRADIHIMIDKIQSKRDKADSIRRQIHALELELDAL